MKYHMLNEGVNKHNIVNQPFIDNHDDMVLYHGTVKISEPTEMEFRFRSKPMSTIKELHEKINELSEDKFGIPVRNLLFTYPNDSDSVMTYGNSNVIVPIGKNYRIFYHPSLHDMTEDLNVGDYSDIPIKNITDELMELDDGSMGEYYRHYVEWLQEHEELTSGDYSGIIGAFYNLEDNAEQDNDFVHVHLKNFIKNNKKDILDIIMKAVKESIDSIAHQYVSGLEELGEDENVDGVEMMVYAPNGFYIMPEQQFFNMI